VDENKVFGRGILKVTANPSETSKRQKLSSSATAKDKGHGDGGIDHAVCGKLLRPHDTPEQQRIEKRE